MLLLFSFFGNVSRSGSIVVVGDPIFANVSGFGVVVGNLPVWEYSFYEGESAKMVQSGNII